MGETKSDGSGHFLIKGHAEEFTSIEPKMNIYYDCNDGPVNARSPSGFRIHTSAVEKNQRRSSISVLFNWPVNSRKKQETVYTDKIEKMFLLLLLSLTSFSAALGRTQSVGVKGVLMCNDQPASGVEVKLYDEDKLSPDEKMGETKSDGSGHFLIKGHAEEFTSIEPKMNIYHDCNDGIKSCQHKITIWIPDTYISSGEEPKKIFDFGTFQLASKFSGETRDCLHR